MKKKGGKKKIVLSFDMKKKIKPEYIIIRQEQSNVPPGYFVKHYLVLHLNLPFGVII